MLFRTVSGNGPAFAASTLRLEPATTNTVVHVTLEDNKANVSVTEGILNIVDPSGVQLASLSAGQAGVFQEASAALPADVAGPVTSLTGGEIAAIWILVAAGVATAITVPLVLDEDKPPVVSPSAP